MVESIIPIEIIEQRIYIIRGKKVMLDKDLAELYGVPTRRLNEQIKRNSQKFPEEFMFQLTKEELNNLISQIATSSWGGIRKLPFAFTEYGIAMLSSVLRSERAVQMNIFIIKTFIKLKQILATNEKLRLKIEEHAEKIKVLFDILNKLLEPPKENQKKKFGFLV